MKELLTMSQLIRKFDSSNKKMFANSLEDLRDLLDLNRIRSRRYLVK